MEYIRIKNPEGALTEWADIRQKLTSIGVEINKARILIKADSEQDNENGTVLKITNKSTFLESVATAELYLDKARNAIAWSLPSLEAEIISQSSAATDDLTV